LTEYQVLFQVKAEERGEAPPAEPDGDEEDAPEDGDDPDPTDADLAELVKAERRRIGLDPADA